MNLEKLIEVLDSLEDDEYITLTNPNIIFKEIEVEDGKVYKEFAIPKRLLKKIDYSNISFDNVCIRGLNFTGYMGVKIDPQKVYKQDLRGCTFSGVEFDGSFDYTYMYDTNFAGSKGVRIDPQRVYKKDLRGCTFFGVKFIGPFDGAKISRANFTGSKGALISPQKIYYRDFRFCVLSGVIFIPEDYGMRSVFSIIGEFDGAYLFKTNFTGSMGARINPQKVIKRDLSGCIFSGVEFDGSFDGANIFKTNFTGSRGAIINPQTVINKDLSGCIFSGVEFIGSFDGMKLDNADFTGSKGAKINPQTIYYDDLSTCVLTDTEVMDIESIGIVRSETTNNETEIIIKGSKLMRKKN